MSVTLPNYAWDFRQALSSNSTIADSINGKSITYDDGIDSTVSTGLRVNNNGDDADFTGTTLTIPSTFSFEIYLSTYGNIYQVGGDSVTQVFKLQNPSYDSSKGFYIQYYANYLWVYYPTSETSNSSTYIHHNKSQWAGNSTFHIVVTFSGTTSKLYVNGSLTNTETLTTAFNNGVTADFGGDISRLCGSGTGQSFSGTIYSTRIYSAELSDSEVNFLYSNRATVNYFSFANLRINYGDVYLAQTLNKTIEDYKNENISLLDISFGAFTAINRLKETYIQGPVDISGDLIVRSDNNVFYDISAANIGFTQRTVTTVTDASYAVFASTTSSYTNTNIADPNGVSNYSGHRYGRSVDMSRDGNYIAAGVLAEGRAHVWKVDDMTVTHLGQLSNPIGTSRFGNVRISGDGSKAVVCDHNNASTASQFTYTWSNPGSTTGTWSEVTTARMTNGYAQGRRPSMSQDGNVFIKGGDANVDENISTWIWDTDKWSSPGHITSRASGSNLSDNALNVDGTICVVGGSRYDSNKGYIAVYKYSKATTETDGSWNSLGDYIDINETDGTTLQYWGTDVCINDAGDIVAAAALGDGTTVTYDLIKAYKYSTPGVLGGTWTQLGDDMKPTAGLTNEGTSVQNMDMNGDGSIIAYGMDAAGTSDGAVVVYQYSLDPQIAGGTWSQIAFIDRPTTSSNLTNWNFGTSVRLNSFGNKLHVGITPGGTAGVGYTYLINIDHTVNYRSVTTTSTPKVVTNDLSLNNRFFVGGDASFNGNVTIQGDLSLGSTISLSNTLANSAVNVDTTGVNTFTNDVSLNANLAIHGKTTVKNDLYLNAYTDVSANPVLSDGTYLKNMKMDKLNHRYIMDISRSAPFSTLTSNTLPSEIWDNSSNSGICVSADGKHIRTVNLSDISGNASSYYSNDYGNSFHKDNTLSRLLAVLDVSLNDNGNNYLGSPPLTKFGADKVYMSYNGQHQLVPRGWSVQPSLADFLYVSNDFGNTWNIRKSAEVSTTTHNYTVTANGSSNYIFSSTNYTIHQQGINMYLNESVQFTIDTTTNGNHPFKIGTSANGDEITDSTITSVTSGSNQIITFKPTTSGTFYYYCSAHSGMGNSIIVEEQNGNFGKGWNWYSGAVSANGKYMFVSGNEGIWRSQDFGTNWYNTANDMSLNNITISATGQHVYGIAEREVYGSSDYGSSFSKIYTDPSPVAFDFSTITSSTNDIWKTTATSSVAATLPVGGYMGHQNSTSYDGRFHLGTVGSEIARNYPIQQVRNADPNNTDVRRAACVFYYDDTVDNGFKPDQTDWTNYTSYRNGSAMSGSGKYLWVRSTLTTNGGPNVFIRSEDYGNTWLMDSTFNGVNPNVDMNNTDMVFSAEGCIASNFEGDRVLNFGGQNGMWFSIDYGKTWGPFGYDANKNPHSSITVMGTTYTSLPTGGPNVGYMGASLSMSENGQYILYGFGQPANSTPNNSCAFLSTDYGLTFTVVAVNSTLNAFGEYTALSCDMSSDGQYMGLIVGADSNASNGHRGLYISQDYGSTWTQKFSDTDWQRRSDIIMSGDAKIMVYNHRAESNQNSSNTYIKISVDYGSTWTSPYATVTDGSTPDGTNNFTLPAHRSNVISKNGQYIYIGGTDITTGVVPYQTPPFSKIETSGNGKYITISQKEGSTILLSSDYGNSFTLHTLSENGTLSLNCGISHSGKIILNSNFISFNYGNNFHYVPNLISNNLSNRDTFYSKANIEYILDPSNNALLQIPYKSAIFQDIYSVGSIKAGSTTYSSDYRLKENIQPLTDNETVNELHPVKYYNTNLKKNDYGLLAHELQEKYPFLVSGEKDGAENQSINYNALISLLVHEVKNLKKEYQELVEMKNNA